MLKIIIIIMVEYSRTIFVDMIDRDINGYKTVRE